MHRFYIPRELWNPDDLRLSGAESHHCVDVLRLQAGDRVTVFNGCGTEALGEIAVASKATVRLRAIQVTQSAPLPCRIALGQAIPKGKNMELIIQKATELGASDLIPLISERTVVRLDPEEAAGRRGKWEQVVVEAAKQCGQNWLPKVHEPVSPKAFFQQKNAFDLMLVAALQSDAMHPRKILAEYSQQHAGEKPKSVLVLVGPEGDFTPAELALARSSDCRPMTLGPIVLRTETAALYCVSILSYELQSVV